MRPVNVSFTALLFMRLVLDIDIDKPMRIQKVDSVAVVVEKSLKLAIQCTQF